MGIFDKKAKKIKQELAKKSLLLFKESVRETEELYNDLKTDYDSIENVMAEFVKFIAYIEPKLDKKDADKINGFSRELNKIDKCARDGVRDVRYLLRNQKKRLKETVAEI